ncbi:hypothetical protein MKW94_006210 [Papaver nudicaule]|uniref:Uncharacterized protein n=1 Tax=Papaver nudicaule TaxID=74823 RepID=A0AA41SN27_PAPNU|nr:hypothetical protein [Papaver nudicaule]
MENSINGKTQKLSENLRMFNDNVSLHTSYQTQCFRNQEDSSLDEMIDSTCSSPYVSAPSSPGSSNRGCYNSNNGYFFSAPASPMHYIQSKSISVSSSATVNLSSSGSFEFDFSTKTNSISTADELFLNGQIRPMKLSSHLQKPRILTPLIDLENEEEEAEESVFLKREGRLRNGSIHRRTRSLSPLRNSHSQWRQQEEQRRGQTIIFMGRKLDFRMIFGRKLDFRKKFSAGIGFPPRFSIAIACYEPVAGNSKANQFLY